MTDPPAPDEAKVFLSYSRKDRERAQAVADELRARHFGVFRDTDDILPTEEWKDRLQQLIEEADTIVFLLSPHSATSEICAWEVEHAASLNKRIAPIVIDDVEGADIPPLLARLNFIFCTPRDPFENAIDTLCSALSTDIDWIREHTRIGGLALRWDGAGQPARLLPRGQDIEDMERWRDARPPGTPEVTQRQAAYIASARRAAAQRLRGWLIGGAVTIAATAALAVFAYLQSLEADRQRVVAQNNAIEARSQRDRAETQRTAAEAARAEAVDERNAALLNQSRFLAGLSDQMLAEGRAAEALALAYEALPQNADAPERPLSQAALRALRHARLDLREIARLDGQDRIGAAIYSPNGNGLATADTAGGIVVRDARTGAALLDIDAHPPGFVSMAFGANNGFLLTGGADWTPKLWSMSDGSKMTDIHGMGGIVTAVAVSDDTSRVAAADFEGRVKMWDTGTGKAIGSLGTLAGGIARLDFTPGGKALVALSYDETRMWHASDGREIARFADPDDRVTAFALRPSGNEIALGRQNGDIELRRATDGTLMVDVTGQHANAVTRLVYSPDGWTIGSIDLIASYATLIRAEVGAPLGALFGHEARLTDIAFSHDSAFVLTGADEGAARLWDAERGQTIALLGGHREGVARVGFSPAADTAFTISGDGIARLWTAPAPQVGKSLSTGDWYTLATAFTPEGTPQIVRRDSAARLGQDMSIASEFRHDLDGETGAISADQRHFAVADKNGAVAVFSFTDGARIAEVALPAAVTALTFDTGADTLLLGLKDGAVLRWPWSTHTPAPLHEGSAAVVEIRTDGARTGILTQAGYSVLDADGAIESRSAISAGTAFLGGIAPDLSRYAVFGPAGEVSLRAANGDLVRVLTTQFKSFQLIRFSADGTALIVGGGAGGVSVFDTVTGAPLARLSAHRDGVTSAALQGDQLLTGDRAGTVHLRPLYRDPVSAIAEAGIILDRLSPLSDADRCRFFLAPPSDCAD